MATQHHDRMGHSIRFKTRDGSEELYRFEASNYVEPKSGIGGRDRLVSDTAAEGRVVSGIDEWEYGGVKKLIRGDMDNLLVSINHGEWHPISAFDSAEPWGRTSGNKGTVAQNAGHSGDIGWRPQSRTSGQKKRHGIEFERVVHAVHDLGWKPDRKGRGPVNDIPVRDGMLIEVPDDEFVVDKAVLSGVKNWGAIGLGENSTLRVPNSRCLRLIQCSSNHLSRNILVENLTFDQRAGMEAGIELRMNVADGLHIENCRRVGKTPNRRSAGMPLGEEPNGITVNIAKGGEGVITHWTDHCETVVLHYPRNAQGMFAGWDCKGTLTLRDATIKNQGEHAIYASKARKVHIENCELMDNANTNCRIAGSGSYAKDTTIGYTRNASYTDHHDALGRKATKGLRAEHSRGHGVTGGRFENCRFVWKTEGLDDGLLVYIMGNVGGMEFRECLFHNDTNDETVLIDPEGSGWRKFDIPGDASVRFERCRFEGSTAQPPVHNKRDARVVMDGCEVAMPNAPDSIGL